MNNNLVQYLLPCSQAHITLILSLLPVLVLPSELDSPLTAPDNERDASQTEHSGEHAANNEHVVDAHAGDPRWDAEDQSCADGVAHEDDTDESVSEDLRRHVSTGCTGERNGLGKTPYVLVRVLHIGERHVATAAERESDEACADGVDDPCLPLEYHVSHKCYRIEFVAKV